MKRSALGLAACLAMILGPVSGTVTRAEEPLDSHGPAVHAPMPIPEMPVPDELLSGSEPEGLLPLAPPPPEVPGALAPAIAVGFPALGDNNRAIPPDTHGAVGLNHVMTMLNTQVRIQTRAGGVLSTVPLNGGPLFVGTGFWASVNADDQDAFDPRVLYDPGADRWMAVVCDEPRSAQSAILVAVSQSADPTGAWFFWRIDVDGLDVGWADYPTMGFNRRWIVVQVNIYDTPGSFLRTQIYALDKAQLYAGVLSYHLEEVVGIGATQVPAATYDNTLDDIFLLQTWNSGAGTLRLWKLTGATALPSLVSVAFPTAPGWTQEAAGRVDFAPQAQGGPGMGCAYCGVGPCVVPERKVQANDSRIQGLVYRNGTLWAAHTVLLPAGTPNRSSVQWWQLGTLGNVLQRGLVDDPTGSRFFAFPSIAVNKNDDVLLGYSSFEDTQWVSGSYSFRTAIDPPSTMQSESLLKPGEACYYKDFAVVPPRNRWGDYSATVVDPTDDLRLWTLQEYAALSAGNGQFDDRWGTWWGMLDPTPEVRIDDVAASEGDSGTTVFSFRVQLTDVAGNALPTSQTVTVDWRTGDGSATTADLDYVGVASDTLVFNPGETVRFVDVTVNGDIKLEGNETFIVDLTGATNATIADNQATGTILNDDPVPRMSIGDVTMIEGTGLAGTFTDFVFPITLSNPRDTAINVTWATANGTATAGAYNAGDFLGLAPSVLILPAGSVSGSVTVQVHPDTLVELAPDELFYVDLSAPIGAVLLKTRGVGRIQDDDTANPGVLGFSVVSDGDAVDGRNRLQWLTPASVTVSDFVHIRYTEGATCTPPTLGSGSGPILVPADPGNTQRYEHTPLVLDRQYCYSLWIESPATVFSPRQEMSARPFNAAAPGKVKWKLFLGTTTLAAPTVGLDAVVGVSNTTFVHAMLRDPSLMTPVPTTDRERGEWPAPWKPIGLGAIAQHRSPIVPISGVSRAFIATQDGRVHAIDTLSGNLLWSTQLPEGAAQGAPAGIFTAFGGAHDYVLVGTSAAGNNRFYALDPFTGAVIDAFPNPLSADANEASIASLGAVLGAAAVDYAGAGRVYFTSRLSSPGNESVWCLDLGPSSDALKLGWKMAFSPSPTDVDGSPVLRGGRVYVPDNSGRVWSIPAATGAPAGSYFRGLGGGMPKGFLFPDRGSNALYLATSGQVYGLVDNGTGLPDKWPQIGLSQPSIVLLEPGTSNLYVGVRNYSGTASLVRIDTATGTPAASVPLELGTPQTVGAPSLDIGFNMIHVGSEAGILYAVELPF